MKICIKCQREMRCFKTGAIAHFGHGHCYAGDIYECPECGEQTMVCNNQSYHNENIASANPNPNLMVVDMTKNNG
jgi:hypothetical protein